MAVLTNHSLVNQTAQCDWTCCNWLQLVVTYIRKLQHPAPTNHQWIFYMHDITFLWLQSWNNNESSLFKHFWYWCEIGYFNIVICFLLPLYQTTNPICPLCVQVFVTIGQGTRNNLPIWYHFWSGFWLLAPLQNPSSLYWPIYHVQTLV